MKSAQYVVEAVQCFAPNASDTHLGSRCVHLTTAPLGSIGLRTALRLHWRLTMEAYDLFLTKLDLIILERVMDSEEEETDE